MATAFAGSAPACLVTGNNTGLTRDTQRRSAPVSTVARRRRVLAIDGSAPDQKPKEEESSSLSNADSEGSDLSLPDLRALFESSGDPNCEQCRGNGTTQCPVCQAQGFITMTMMDTVSSTQCRLCKGKKRIPCPSCRGEVYKSVLWWDLIPSEEEDPEEKWREGPDGKPRVRWSDNPAGPAN